MSALAGAIERLDEITRRLRRECPWDREQDERSIVPHTVEEAYELADAAHSGDDAKMLGELGDVLFQVVFLSLLLEERGASDLAQVAEHCRQKLIRRHPHVFGSGESSTAPGEERSRRDEGSGARGRDEGSGARGNDVPAALLPEAATSAEVLRNWDRIKAETEGGGLFGDLPETLPATLYAKKAQRRGARAEGQDAPAPGVAESAAALDEADGREERFAAAGELLFAAVAEAAGTGVDPELALRAAADRYIARIQEEQESS
ncbi:MAG: nucleoside triphosphate pyrophosphohydrolase [Actinomycetota bacterium]|nr:nucleoside triphosphate pyrophosphohydrolase [Actinomycetota bacterium]